MGEALWLEKSYWENFAKAVAAGVAMVFGE
jgi:hypothetical protein